MKSDSRLEKVLTAGGFAVTAELGPPQNANPEAIKKKAQYYLGNVDGANITDNQTAIVRMSSIAAAAIAISRIAMQSDILGAAALGVKNLLCLSGDHQKFGNHPEAANVFDLDSVQLIAMVKRMRDDKQFLSGDPIKEHEPRLFIGAVANGAAIGQEGRSGGRFHPDAVRIRCGEIRQVDETRCGRRSARESVYYGGADAGALAQGASVYEDGSSRYEHPG